MPAFLVELDDGRKYRVEADRAPTNDEVMQSLGLANAAPQDSGQGYASTLASEFGRGVASPVAGAIGGVGYMVGSESLKDTANSIDAAVNSFLPVNPIYEDQFIPKATQAAGQAFSMLVTGGIGGAAGKALGGVRAGAEIAGLGTGYLQGVRGGGQDADRYGMTGANAYARAILGGVTELASEKLLFGMGTETALARRLMGETLESGAGAFGKAVGTEAAEEVAAQIGGNISNKALAPEGVQTPGLLEGTVEAGALGAVGGATFGTVNALAGTGQAKPVTIESGIGDELPPAPWGTMDTVIGPVEYDPTQLVTPEALKGMPAEKLQELIGLGYIRPPAPVAAEAAPVVEPVAPIVEPAPVVQPVVAPAVAEPLPTPEIKAAESVLAAADVAPQTAELVARIVGEPLPVVEVQPTPIDEPALPTAEVVAQPLAEQTAATEQTVPTGSGVRGGVEAPGLVPPAATAEDQIQEVEPAVDLPAVEGAVGETEIIPTLQRLEDFDLPTSERLVSEARAGDARSKNEGKKRPEGLRGPVSLVELPMSSFSEDTREFIRTSTRPERVQKYVDEKVDTPIYALPNKDGSFRISDGGHRLMAAVQRGDKTIKAYVPTAHFVAPQAPAPAKQEGAQVAGKKADVQASVSPQPSLVQQLRAKNEADLPPAALTKWTPEVYTSAEKFEQSGDVADLASLTPVQRRRVIAVYDEVKPETAKAVKAREQREEQRLRKQEKKEKESPYNPPAPEESDEQAPTEKVDIVDPNAEPPSSPRGFTAEFDSEGGYVTSPEKVLKGSTPAQIQPIIDGLRRRLPGMPNVQIVSSAEVESAPRFAAARAYFEGQGILLGDLRAWFKKSNKTVYLVADNLEGPAMIRRALLHEVIGHMGVNAIATSSERRRISRIIERYDPELAERVKNIYKTTRDTELYADELLARFAEGYRSADPENFKQMSALKAVWDEIKRLVHAMIRRLGGDPRAFDDVAMHNFYTDAVRAVVNGRVPGRGPAIQAATDRVIPRHVDVAYQSILEHGDSGNDLLGDDSDAWLARNPKSQARLQTLVDQAAEMAGYNPEPLWHGSKYEFDQFVEGKNGLIFLADDEEYAGIYGVNVRKFYVAAKKPLKLTKWEPDEDVSGKDFETTLKSLGVSTEGLSPITGEPLQQLSQRRDSNPLQLKENVEEAGYDSIKINEYFEGAGKATSTALFNPSQIKSADLITRDDAGEPIPLSQRFNPQTDDIRTSLSNNEQVLADAAAVARGDKPASVAVGKIIGGLQEGGKRNPIFGNTPKSTKEEGSTIQERLAHARRVSDAQKDSDFQASVSDQPLNQEHEKLKSAYIADFVLPTTPEGQVVAGHESRINAFSRGWLAKAYGVSANGTHQFWGSLSKTVVADPQQILQASPDENGNITIGVRAPPASIAMGEAHSAEALKKYLADSIDEEMIHVADLLAMRAEWVAAGKQGSFNDFLSDQASTVLAEMGQIYEQALPADKQAFDKATAASLALYNDAEGLANMQFDKVLKALAEEGGEEHYRFVAEFVRQMVQLHQSGELTETGWARIVQVFQQWMQRALEALKLASAQVRHGKMGKMLQRRVEQAEVILSQLKAGEIPISEGTSDESGSDMALQAPVPGNPDKRYSDIGERMAVDPSRSDVFRDLPVSEFSVAKQKETHEAAAKIILESGLDLAYGKFTNLENDIPPHVRLAGLMQLAQQYELEANAAEKKGNPPGSEEYDNLMMKSLEAKVDVETRLNAAGREVNLANTWARMTPQGILRRTERMLTKTHEAAAKQNFGPEYDKLMEQMAKIKNEFAAAKKLWAKSKLDTAAEELSEAEKTDDEPRKTAARKKLTEELKALQVAQRTIDRMAVAHSDTPSTKDKPKVSPLQALITQHIKSPVDGFVDQVMAIKVPRAEAQQLHEAIERNRSKEEAVARAKALQDTIEAFQPKTRKAREALPKILRSVLNADKDGILSRTEFAAAFSDAFDLPHLTMQDRSEIAKLSAVIHSLPENSTSRDIKTLALMNKLALIKGVTATDAIMGMWYANILAGPSTQAVNLWGNGTLGLMRTLSLMVSNGNLRDALAMIKGMVGPGGFRRGVMEARNTLRDGGLHKDGKLDEFNSQTALELLYKMGVPKGLAQWIAWVGSLGYATRYVFRAMAAADAVFWYMADEGFAHLAVNKAIRETGLKPGTQEFNAEVIKRMGNIDSMEADREQARAEYAKAGLPFKEWEVDRRAWQLRRGRIGTDVTKGRVRWADRLTLQQEPEGVGKHISKFINLLQSVKVGGVPILRPMVPFNRVVSNLFESGLDFAGVGILRGLLGHHLTDKDAVFDNIERRERFTAGVMGITVAGLALAQALKFEDDDDPWFAITGMGPREASKREQWMASGFRPFTMKVGDKIINYAETPTGMLLAGIGSWMDARKYNKMENKSAANRFFLTALAALRGFSSQGVLSSVGDTLDVLSGDVTPKQAVAVPLRAVGGAVPLQGLLRDAAILFDPNKIDETDLYASMVKDIPVLKSVGTRPALNVFGEPVDIQGLPVVRRFVTKQKVEPVFEFLGKNKLLIPSLPASIEIGQYLGSMKKPVQDRAIQMLALENGMMTPNQRYAFVQRSGELTKEAVEQIMANAPANPTAEQRTQLQKTIKARTQDARERAMYDLVRTIK